MSQLSEHMTPELFTGTRAAPSAERAVHESRLPGVAALLVFCLFAASALALLTFGVNAYHIISEKPRQGYEDRAGLSYVWTKLKNADAAGQVYLSELEGLPVLCLAEAIGERTYVTMLYHYEGSLRELFAEAGFENQPEDGVPILEGESLLFGELEGGLIQVTSGARTLYIVPRADAPPKGGE
jgi:hypothetical protein